MSDEAPQAFAAPEDLAKRWRDLTDAETFTASVLLGDASDKIRTRVKRTSDPQWVAGHALTLERICCAMVKRAMQQSVTGLPDGVSQSTTTTGPFTDGYTWSNPDGNLYLAKEDLRDLGLGAQTAFHADPTNPETVYGDD
jgi:hypothetical protein